MSAVTGGGGAQLSAAEPLSVATRRLLRVLNLCVGVVLGAEGVLMLVARRGQIWNITDACAQPFDSFTTAAHGFADWGADRDCHDA